MHSKRTQYKSLITPILFIIGILGIWELLVNFFSIPEYLLPSPVMITKEIGANLNLYLFHSGITVFETVSGYMIANILGFLVAILFTYSKTIEQGLYPYAIAIKTTPIIAIAPILVVWLGSGTASKIVTSALICFFPMLVNATKGFSSIDKDAFDLLRSLKSTKVQIFTKLRFPTALPYIFSALKISTGLAVVGAIVGEFVGAKYGLGFLTLTASYYLDTTKMFAAVAMSAFIGIIFFFIISQIEKKIIFWHKANNILE